MHSCAPLLYTSRPTLSTTYSLSNKTPKTKGKCGTNNFGSTGQPQIFWTSSVTTAQPTLTCTIDGKNFKGLVDTGADVSIIKSNEWPSDWPTISPTSTLIRVGGMQQPRQSSHLRLPLALMGKLLRWPHLLPLYHAHLREEMFWDNLGQQYRLIQHHRKVLECASKTLKTMLDKQKKGELECPHNRLAKALHVLSF